MPIRKAVIEDIKDIHRMLNKYSDKGLLLPRSLSELYDHLRDYSVVEEDNSGHNILGVCGLGICWEDLAEIKSLAVREDNRARGLGKSLVQSCLKEAEKLRLGRVFTLTYIPDYFKKFGFKEIEKAALPHKVWADCLKCPKFPECDETALIFDL
ncbi:N-acetyltransferase [Thermodesulfobacteriota bacterium]